MTIANEKFVAQCVTQKGKYYYFDDLACLIRYKKENNNMMYTEFYVADFNAPKNYISVNDALLLHGEEIMSPMGGNIVAFSNQKDAEKFTQEHQVTTLLWMDLIK
jgi:copper chaperone NosL